MANSHGIVTQDAPTGVAPQTSSYTKAGLGTIKGAIMLASKDVAVNTDFADVQFHIGVTDLTNEQMAGCNYEDNVAASDTKTLTNASKLMAVAATPGDDTETEGCVDNGTVTDGLDTSWNPTSSAVLTSLIMMKEGIDNLWADLVTLSGTGSTTVTPGFQADFVIVVSTGQVTPTFGNNDFDNGVQFYDRAQDTYAGYFIGGNHNSTTPDSSTTNTTAAVGGNLDPGGTLNDEYTLGNFTATQFDFTKVAQTNSQVVLVIAIKLADGYSGAIGSASAPVSTGVTSIVSGLSFQPQLALLSVESSTAFNNPQPHARWSFGACDADAECCISGWVEHAGATVQNANGGGSHRDDSCMYLRNFDGSNIDYQASFDSFQSDGLDINQTTADIGVKVNYLMIGNSPSANIGSQVKQRLYST